MNVVLFGSTGFLGNAVYKILLSRGYEVFCVPRELDISEYFRFSLKNKIDVVINCAAKVPPHDDKMIEVNSIGANFVAEYAWLHGAHLIHCSSLSIFKKPWVNLMENSTNYVGKEFIYGYSKLLGELEVLAKPAQSCVLRFSAIYGRGMKNGIIPNFISKISSNEDIESHNDFYANFIHVADAAEIVVRTAEQRTKGIFNIASNEMFNMSQLAYLISQNYNYTGKITNVKSGKMVLADINTSKMRNYLYSMKLIPLSIGIGLIK